MSEHNMDEHHAHSPHGGPAPDGMNQEPDPRYPVGSSVTLIVGHMPGMQGVTATVAGAFRTTTYSVSYTPAGGGDRVVDHKWVVHEELRDAAAGPLTHGTTVILDAAHMPGMRGAKAAIESATDETVYMVDLDIDGVQITNHRWVVESEIRSAP